MSTLTIYVQKLNLEELKEVELKNFQFRGRVIKGSTLLQAIPKMYDNVQIITLSFLNEENTRLIYLAKYNCQNLRLKIDGIEYTTSDYTLCSFLNKLHVFKIPIHQKQFSKIEILKADKIIKEISGKDYIQEELVDSWLNNLQSLVKIIESYSKVFEKIQFVINLNMFTGIEINYLNQLLNTVSSIFENRVEINYLTLQEVRKNLINIQLLNNLQAITELIMKLLNLFKGSEVSKINVNLLKDYLNQDDVYAIEKFVKISKVMKLGLIPTLQNQIQEFENKIKIGQKISISKIIYQLLQKTFNLKEFNNILDLLKNFINYSIEIQDYLRAILACEKYFYLKLIQECCLFKIDLKRISFNKLIKLLNRVEIWKLDERLNNIVQLLKELKYFANTLLNLGFDESICGEIPIIVNQYPIKVECKGILDPEILRNKILTFISLIDNYIPNDQIIEKCEEICYKSSI